MTKLVTLIIFSCITVALLGASTAATAATMSCYVDTPANDPFTPEYCSALVPGARSATAVFRVDSPLPQNFRVQWSDSSCNPGRSTCAVTISAFVEKTMYATVSNLDNCTASPQVSATAYFEDAQ